MSRPRNRTGKGATGLVGPLATLLCLAVLCAKLASCDDHEQSGQAHSAPSGQLSASGSRTLLAGTTYPLASAGAQLEKLITSLQPKATSPLPPVYLGIHGGSLAAAVTERLGVYLQRPPEVPPAGLDANQSSWLRGSWARQVGWQAAGGGAAAAAAGVQQVANAGGIALAVAPPGCSQGATGTVAIVVPNGTIPSSTVAKDGPTIALLTKRGTVRQLLRTCFMHGKIQYFIFKRAADVQVSPYFTRVWLNPQYPDAQYLFDVGPGGRVDAVVIYYTSYKSTSWLFGSFGANTTGWAFTAWNDTIWEPSSPPTTPPIPLSESSPTAFQPYYFKEYMQVNFTLHNHNSSLIYYKYKHKQAVMSPQPGSGACIHASCGFWYAEDPTIALAFYVTARTRTRLAGKLLTFAGSYLIGKQMLIDKGIPKTLPQSMLPIPYKPAAALPFEFVGASSQGTKYAGEFRWMPHWGMVASSKKAAVVQVLAEGGRLMVAYHGRTAYFTKGTHLGAGLPALV